MRGLVLLFLVAQVFAHGTTSYYGDKVISFSIQNELQASVLVEFSEAVPGVHLWNEHVLIPGNLDIHVNKNLVDRIISIANENQISYSIIHHNLGQDIDNHFQLNEKIQANEAANFFDSYQTYDSMNTFLSGLASDYSNLARLVNVGKSINGNVIYGLVISGSNPRYSIVLNGCQHAREWISPMTVAYLAQQFLQDYNTDSEVKSLVDNFEWTIIPIVNPDGYEWTWSDDRLWRKNRRQNSGSNCFGVDTNRNWDYQWGTGGSSNVPCADTYRGTSGFSEPEETAVANYISAKGNVVAYVDFHAYGQYWMYPWGYTCNQEVANNVTQNYCATNVTAAIKSVNKLSFTVGPVCQTIYQASGGSNDWTYGAAQVPFSYACELRGNSFVIPADQIIPSGEEIWAGVKAMGDYILNDSNY